MEKSCRKYLLNVRQGGRCSNERHAVIWTITWTRCPSSCPTSQISPTQKYFPCSMLAPTSTIRMRTRIAAVTFRIVFMSTKVRPSFPDPCKKSCKMRRMCWLISASTPFMWRIANNLVDSPSHSLHFRRGQYLLSSTGTGAKVHQASLVLQHGPHELRHQGQCPPSSRQNKLCLHRARQR